MNNSQKYDRKSVTEHYHKVFLCWQYGKKRIFVGKLVVGTGYSFQQQMKEWLCYFVFKAGSSVPLNSELWQTFVIIELKFRMNIRMYIEVWDPNVFFEKNF